MVEPALDDTRGYFKSLRANQPQNSFCVGTDGGPLFLHPCRLVGFLTHCRVKSGCNIRKIDIGSLVERWGKNLRLGISHVRVGHYLTLTTLEQELERVKRCYLEIIFLIQVRSKRVTNGRVLNPAFSLTAYLRLGELCMRLVSARSNLYHRLLQH